MLLACHVHKQPLEVKQSPGFITISQHMIILLSVFIILFCYRNSDHIYDLNQS